MATKISQRARDMIERFEVTDRDTYEKSLARLTWPKDNSGVTGGIGYDFGYQTAVQIMEDWKGILLPHTLTRLCALSGITGHRAALAVRGMSDIVIPYDAALHVFELQSIPRYTALTISAFPGIEELPADCLGALVSLVYNRGASTTGDRRQEMYEIKTAIANKNDDLVPGYIIDMKRLWMDDKGNPLPDMAGLLMRRDVEADMFALGLNEPEIDPLGEPWKRSVDPTAWPAPGTPDYFARMQAATRRIDAEVDTAVKNLGA